MFCDHFIIQNFKGVFSFIRLNPAKKVNIKVLLIDDVPKYRIFTKPGLEEQLFEVDVAFDGHIRKRLALNIDYTLFFSMLF